jgi:nitrous oxide reductase accessory protein NosL
LVRITKANLIWIAALGAVLLIFGTGLAETKNPVQPSKKDKCPVCGMFVYKYPDWLAEIIFKDGSVDFFDGAKDLFKYYFNLAKYKPGKNKKNIAAIYVMEYYDMQLIDARKAFFIIGSDIYGPMGHELIPFATEEDASAFMKDHKGKRILRFEAITPRVIDKLD